MEALVSSVPEGLWEMIAAAPIYGLAFIPCEGLIRHFQDSPPLSKHLEQLSRPGLTACAKNANAAAISKRNGNVAFGECDYNRALSLYTKALRDAPFSSEKSEMQVNAVILVNRAATLHKLGHLENSAKDCDRALECNPEYSKAWYRRGQVKYDLRDFEGALVDMERALACEASPINQSQIKEELTRMELEKKTVLDSGREKSCLPPPDSRASDVQLPKVPTEGLQHGKECWTDEKNRGVAAQEDLAAGTLVLKESPYTAVILKGARDTYCHFCFDLLPTNPVACNGCAIPLYCTDACKAHASGVDIDQDGLSTRIGEHIPECGGASWSAALPSDAVLAARMLRHTKHFDSDLHKSSFQLSAVHQVEIHVLATIIAHCMKQSVPLTATVPIIASKLVPLIAQVKNNGMSIHGLVSSPRTSGYTSKKGVDLEYIDETHVIVAKGIFTIGSRFNHSCIPNVHASFISGRLYVRAIMDVLKGSALELCYGPEVGRLNQRERRDQLQKTYFFNCTCSSCSCLSLPDILLQSFRCSKSGCMSVVLGEPLNSIFSTTCAACGAYPGAEETQKKRCASPLTGMEEVPHITQFSPGDIDGKVFNSRFAKQRFLHKECKAGICLFCGTEVDIKAARETSSAASSHIKRILTGNGIINTSLEELIQGVMTALNRLRGAVHAYNKQLAESEDVAARLLYTSGDRRRALEHCQRSIEISTRLHGKHHIGVGHEHIKLASTALLVPLLDHAQNSLAIADRIFTTHYGSDYRRMYPFVETLEEMALRLS